MIDLTRSKRAKSSDGQKSALRRGPLWSIALAVLPALFPAGGLAQSLPACPAVTWFKQPTSHNQDGDILCALTFIADGHTAIAPATCVESHTELVFKSSNGDFISASVVAKSEDMGLAVLRHSGCEGGYTLAQAAPKAGNALSYVELLDGVPKQRGVKAKTPQPRRIGEIVAVDTSGQSFPGGSPLLAESGQLVGILTHHLVTKEGAPTTIAVAVGFIPICYAIEEVGRVGVIRRPARLGLAVQDLTPELATAFNVKPQGGVVISKVTENSAAEVQGLKMGDIVMAVNGTPIEGLDHFFTYIAYRHQGDMLTLEIIRSGKRFSRKIFYPEDAAE